MTQIIVTDDAALAAGADRVLQLRGGRLHGGEPGRPRSASDDGWRGLSQLGA